MELITKLEALLRDSEDEKDIWFNDGVISSINVLRKELGLSPVPPKH